MPALFYRRGPPENCLSSHSSPILPSFPHLAFLHLHIPHRRTDFALIHQGITRRHLPLFFRLISLNLRQPLFSALLFIVSAGFSSARKRNGTPAEPAHKSAVFYRLCQIPRVLSAETRKRSSRRGGEEGDGETEGR